MAKNWSIQKNKNRAEKWKKIKEGESLREYSLPLPTPLKGMTRLFFFFDFSFLLVSSSLFDSPPFLKKKSTQSLKISFIYRTFFLSFVSPLFPSHPRVQIHSYPFHSMFNHIPWFYTSNLRVLITSITLLIV